MVEKYGSICALTTPPPASKQSRITIIGFIIFAFATRPCAFGPESN
jgi:hypothetical protein